MSFDTLGQARAQARRTLRLTPRWTQLKPHPMQQLFFWHPAPIKVNPSGRRSGKTELVKRKMVLSLLKRRPWPTRLFCGAPTHDQARAIFWEDLKALVPSWWVENINESRLEIWTKWGALLRVVGLDRPQRIEGVPWDEAAIDEIADCQPRCFNRNILPALSTLGRTPAAYLIGVPDEVGRNQAEYEELWETGLQWPHKDKSVCSFHWRSADILEPEKILELKKRMDEFEFEQEYGGRFLRSGGKAIPKFDVAAHVREDYCTYDQRLPLDWSLDFGVGSNAVSLLGQTFKGHVWIMDEIICDDGSTDVQWAELRKRCGMRGFSMRHIRRFGDAAGNAGHSNIGASDYEILDGLAAMDRTVRIESMELMAAPLIKDTVNAVRGRVATADGVVHFHVHPRCKTLVANLKQAPWPDKLKDFHALAALRYYCFALFGESSSGYTVGRSTLPNLKG